MSVLVADRVKETSTTTGTGTFDLDGAASRFITFVAGIGDTNQCYYAIAHATANEWEVGIGTVTDAATDTLSRDTVLKSSNAGALVSFSAGTKDVFVTHPVENLKLQPCAGVSTPNNADGGGLNLDDNQIEVLEWTVEDFDNDNLITPTDVDMNAVKARKYIVCATVQFAANTAGRRFIGIYVNDVLTDTWNQTAPTSTGATAFSLAGIFDLALNDKVEIRVQQTSGGALNLGNGEFSMGGLSS